MLLFRRLVRYMGLQPESEVRVGFGSFGPEVVFAERGSGFPGGAFRPCGEGGCMEQAWVGEESGKAVERSGPRARQWEGWGLRGKWRAGRLESFGASPRRAEYQLRL